MVKPSKEKDDFLSKNQQSNVSVTNLERHSAMRGISPQKIQFIDRVNKEEHILRHASVDLFLDTMTYGAHSTATDALRGVSFF